MGIIVTNKTQSGASLPRLATGESPDVFPGSPLAIIGLWIFALQQRFLYSASMPMPWVWVDNLRPDDDEDGDPLPAGEPRKLLIESAYNVEKDNRNYYPAIYVGRNGGPVKANKISVNNFVGQKKETGFKAFHCLADMPITFECESENQGESSTVAETAWAFVLTTREIFREDFGLHDILEPILGDTVPVKRDKEVWVTPVQFNVQYDVRWGVTPIAPKLRDLALAISGQGGAADYFVQLALRDETLD